MAFPSPADPGERDAAAAERPYVPFGDRGTVEPGQWRMIAAALLGATDTGHSGEGVEGGLALAGPHAVAAHTVRGLGTTIVTLTTARPDGRAAAQAVEAVLRDKGFRPRSPGDLLDWTHDTVAQWAVSLAADERGGVQACFLQICRAPRSESPVTFSSHGGKWQALHPNDVVPDLMWNMVVRGRPEDYAYAGALLARRPSGSRVPGDPRPQLEWTWDDLITMTTDRYPALNRSHFALAVVSMETISDARFAKAGVPAGELGQLRHTFAQFGQHLRDTIDPDPAQQHGRSAGDSTRARLTGLLHAALRGGRPSAAAEATATRPGRRAGVRHGGHAGARAGQADAGRGPRG